MSLFIMKTFSQTYLHINLDWLTKYLPSFLLYLLHLFSYNMIFLILLLTYLLYSLLYLLLRLDSTYVLLMRVIIYNELKPMCYVQL